MTGYLERGASQLSALAGMRAGKQRRSAANVLHRHGSTRRAYNGIAAISNTRSRAACTLARAYAARGWPIYYPLAEMPITLCHLYSGQLTWWMYCMPQTYQLHYSLDPPHCQAITLLTLC